MAENGTRAGPVRTGRTGALSVTCGCPATPPHSAPGWAGEGGGARELLRLRCGRSRAAAAAAAASVATAAFGCRIWNSCASLTMKQSSNVPAFLSKLWTLVEETHTNEFITWSQVRVRAPRPPNPLTNVLLSLSPAGLSLAACGSTPSARARGAGAAGWRGPRRAASRGTPVLFARGAAGVPAGAAGSGRGGGGAARAGLRGPGDPVTVRPGRRSEPARRSRGGRRAQGAGATLLHTHPPSSRPARGLRLAGGRAARPGSSTRGFCEAVFTSAT